MNNPNRFNLTLRESRMHRRPLVQQETQLKSHFTVSLGSVVGLVLSGLVFAAGSYYTGIIRYWGLESELFNFTIESTGIVIGVLLFNSIAHWQFVVAIGVMVILPSIFLIVMNWIISKATHHQILKDKKDITVFLWTMVVFTIVLYLAVAYWLGGGSAKAHDLNDNYTTTIIFENDEIKNAKLIWANDKAIAFKQKGDESISVYPFSKVVSYHKMQPK